MQPSLWKMISSKFKRNAGRKPSWSLGSIPSTNQRQISVSSHDRQIRECYPGEEEEILDAELPVMRVEPEDIWQRIVKGPR
jgi:hypothetical protein